MSWTQRRSSLVPVAEQYHEDEPDPPESGNAPTIAQGFLTAAARRTQNEVDRKTFDAKVATESHPGRHHRHSRARRHSTHAPLIPTGEMFEMYVIPLEQVEMKAHPKSPSPGPEEHEEEQPRLRLPATPRAMKQPFMKATSRGTVVEFELKPLHGMAETHVGRTKTSDLLEARASRLSKVGSSPARPGGTSFETSKTREAEEPEDDENARFLKTLAMSHEQPSTRIVRIYGDNKAQLQTAVNLVDQLENRKKLASTPREQPSAPGQAIGPPTAARSNSVAPNGLENGPRITARRLSAVPSESSLHTAAKKGSLDSRSHSGVVDQVSIMEQEQLASRATSAADIALQPLIMSKSGASDASTSVAPPRTDGSPGLMSGYLQKQSISCCRSKWEARRYFVLAHGILHEYKNEKDYKDHGLPTASEGICILGGLSIKRSRKSTVVFQLVAPGLTLKLRVADEKSSDVWISALIGSVNEGGLRGRATSSNLNRDFSKSKAEPVVTADTVLVDDGKVLKATSPSSPPSMFKPGSQLHTTDGSKHMFM